MVKDSAQLRQRRTVWDLVSSQDSESDPTTQFGVCFKCCNYDGIASIKNKTVFCRHQTAKLVRTAPDQSSSPEECIRLQNEEKSLA